MKGGVAHWFQVRCQVDESWRRIRVVDWWYELHVAGLYALMLTVRSETWRQTTIKTKTLCLVQSGFQRKDHITSYAMISYCGMKGAVYITMSGEDDRQGYIHFRAVCTLFWKDATENCCPPSLLLPDGYGISKSKNMLTMAYELPETSKLMFGLQQAT